jgi:hypothetical protein
MRRTIFGKVKTGEVLALAPATQARYVAFSNITSTSMRISWNNGNGGGRIVVIYPSADYTNPQQYLDYSSQANSNYANGQAVIGQGKVVYRTNTATPRYIDVTGLSPSTTYYVKIFECNFGSQGSPTYKFDASTNNPRSGSTAA